MSTLLRIVAVVAALFGAGYLLTGPLFVGLIWLIISLLAGVSVTVLEYLGRIAKALEKQG